MTTIALSGGTLSNGTMHRRKSSKDENEDNVLVFPPSPAPQSPPATAPLTQGSKTNSFPASETGTLEPPPSRARVTSTPSAISVSQSFPGAPTSAGPYRTSFNVPPRPPPLNGSAYGHTNGRPQPPGMRQSFSLPSAHSQAHSRTRSISGPFSPITPSPLSSSFPPQQLVMPPNKFSSSSTAPELRPPVSPIENGAKPKAAPPRRHSRIHSRNLSVYFPRPGSLPATSIAEDGAQELDFSTPPPDESILMPSASPRPGQRDFREGFTFGARPPAPAGQSSHPISSEPTPPQPSSAGGPSRRGHHHRHSMSHSFFSFLEPGAQSMPDELHTQPTPVPVSPWAPISPFPSQMSVHALDDAAASVAVTGAANGLGFGNGVAVGGGRAKSKGAAIGRIRASAQVSPVAIGVSVWQFVLGAWLWITGQQVGSLACTGLGYWVVFDAFGVALGHVLPNYLTRPSMQTETRRPYGNARVETVMAFAQSVYLIFTSVYVCKETVEHLLLSSGEGHHHHQGDEVASVLGIEFPIRLLFITLISLLSTAIFFNNHAKLVSTAGNRIPSLASLLPSRSRYSASAFTYPPALNNLFTNPYALAPIGFASAVLFTALSLPASQHRPFDLILAGLETIVTFNIAYHAAVQLGAVLLQTSPARGLAGGRMEAFLRAMREIERHPQVLHLPAPHIWQLTPSLAVSDADVVSSPYASAAAVALEKAQGPAQSLVVTLELHVRHDLEDAEVLKLTRWAWERCVHALHFGTRGGEGGEGEAEVTAEEDERPARLPIWLYALDRTNRIVTSLTAVVVLYTRSAGVAYFAASAVLCSVTVKIIKRMVRQPRPYLIVRGKKKKSYGMPSTHSATITYFATYITLACAYLPIHPAFPSSPLMRIFPPLIVIPLASTIAWSRISLGHHTVFQVAAGVTCGLVYAPLMFRLWTHKLNQYGPWAEALVHTYIPV
ncbi:PAP2-domain-containing protein [Dichomitus squalens LYAD-421 SS1]|uniref:PAP2-domain-containing protein n=1 Tax=Dichomitus squalens (strain LYAD-421) TaxID=732165 RepID=R7T2M7_DICSQ|nr:PAP2-domain-containing protein [Dichomitus squalens LYAD-421 SS1]EJF61727.1 PAP2-domain-containing protein [Dichomitus squalens LYAD-421 SS1]